MQTSEQWWNVVKNDSDRTNRWLIGQYRGERLAHSRILNLVEKFIPESLIQEHGLPTAPLISRDRRTLKEIAAQEQQHARWIGDLLTSRGIPLDTIPDRPERYWPKAMESIKDLRTGCAAASHAEKMRLERIAAIVSDPETPTDIRLVFEKILPQELWHERAFRELAGADAMSQTAQNHSLARKALGLA